MKVKYLLYIAIFVTGISGMIAEHTISLIAINMFGNSIGWYVAIISTAMFGMGLGSQLSSKITEKNIVFKFLLIEIILSFLGLLSAITPYYLFEYLKDVTKILIIVYSIIIGMLIGLEIPIIARINEKYDILKDNISKITSLDYYGALVSGILFIFICLPYLGVAYSPIFLSSLNLSVAILLYATIKKEIDNKLNKVLNILFGLTIFSIFIVAFYSKNILENSEQKLFKDPIIASLQTHYQKLILTKRNNPIDGDFYYLYINNGTQWCSRDEAMYHETLVTPVLNAHYNPKKVLILGGGDGMTLREVLKDNRVEDVTLVDLDPDMIKWHKENELLAKLNDYSFFNKKAKVINGDAIKFLEKTEEKFDIVIVDLVDPNSIQIGRLYSTLMYKFIKQVINPDGLFVTQSTSSYYTKNTFLSIKKSIEHSGFNTLSTHINVPSFGEWGFNIGSILYSTEQLKEMINKPLNQEYSSKLKFINNEIISSITAFDKHYFDNYDKIEITTQFDVKAAYYYETESKRY